MASFLEITPTTNPTTLAQAWLDEAAKTEPNDPSAMSLATVDEHGKPQVRMVLLKGLDARGFVFYTNQTSRKAAALAANPRAALCLHWKSLRRQIRVEGAVSTVDKTEADAYFASRSRKSQIGAWASDQSAVLDNRATFEQRVAEVEARFQGQDVPRPDFWGGYRVQPQRIEFWQDGPARMHDRTVFEAQGTAWKVYKLYP